MKLIVGLGNPGREYAHSRHNVGWMTVDEFAEKFPLGKIRIRERGSAGTHNGMRSVVESFASERFPRLRCGVRGANYAEAGRLRDYVLDDFEDSELPAVDR